QRGGFFGEPAIGESKELDIDAAEDRQGAAGFVFANGTVSRFGAVSRHDDAHLPLLADVQRDEAAAADDLIVRMWREDEQALAAQLLRLVGNRLRFGQSHCVDYRSPSIHADAERSEAEASPVE